MSRFERLAKDVVVRLQAYTRCSLFDDDGSPATVWDNYCYNQQKGPAAFLENVWSDTFAPHLDNVIAGLDGTDATLLTFYCCWGESLDPCELVGNPPNGIYEVALATGIMNEVVRLALDREWHDEDDHEDHDDDPFDD